ncbi:MAG: glycerophosphodiester phosphodiesterase [Pseudomonadota bacterium]
MPYHYPTRIFAHRGGGTLAPENTLEAMQLAKQMDFAAVEFDVMLAKDEVPILMHDPVFGRTVPGQGEVAAHTAARLVTMNAGAWQGKPQYAGATVPTFEAVVRYCRANQLFMNIEIKPAPGFEAVTGEVVARETLRLFADEKDKSKWPLFSSFNFAALAAAQQHAPVIDRAMLYTVVPGNWQDDLRALGCVALHTSHKMLKAQAASAIKAAGYGLFVYTVNDADTARAMFAMGVDAMCTDRLDLIGPQFS